MKFEFYCSDCGVEATIEITDNPWEVDEDQMINDCFCCGCDGGITKSLVNSDDD